MAIRKAEKKAKLPTDVVEIVIIKDHNANNKRRALLKDELRKVSRDVAEILIEKKIAKMA